MTLTYIDIMLLVGAVLVIAGFVIWYATLVRKAIKLNRQTKAHILANIKETLEESGVEIQSHWNLRDDDDDDDEIAECYISYFFQGKEHVARGQDEFDTTLDIFKKVLEISDGNWCHPDLYIALAENTERNRYTEDILKALRQIGVEFPILINGHGGKITYHYEYNGLSGEITADTKKEAILLVLQHLITDQSSAAKFEKYLVEE